MSKCLGVLLLSRVEEMSYFLVKVSGVALKGVYLIERGVTLTYKFLS